MTSPHVVLLADGHEISDERARLDMEVVHAALDGAYWATGRQRVLTERAFANSLVLGVYASGNVMVGFGRVLTDYAFRAHVADVMILSEARGRGLGRALVAFALEHPALATVGKWTLTTADAHGLYSRYGFRSATGEPNWMTLDRA